MPYYDPKLKEAIGAIETICRHYDFGGFVSLVSREGGEYRYILPPWIGLKEEAMPEGTALRLKLKKFDPADTANTELADLTGHFLFSLGNTLSYTVGWISNFVDELKRKCDVTHEAFHNFRPHQKDEQ